MGEASSAGGTATSVCCPGREEGSETGLQLRAGSQVLTLPGRNLLPPSCKLSTGGG